MVRLELWGKLREMAGQIQDPKLLRGTSMKSSTVGRRRTATGLGMQGVYDLRHTWRLVRFGMWNLKGLNTARKGEDALRDWIEDW